MSWKECGRKPSWPNFNVRELSRHVLEGLRKTMKNLSQGSRDPDRDLNAGLHEHEAGV
jgi:hypothetical protein